MFIGIGTLVNVATVLVGGLLGLAVGHRLPERTRLLVTQVLGLISLVIGGLSISQGMSQAFGEAVGTSARLLVVLGALLLGGILGSATRLEQRFDGAADWVRTTFVADADQHSFIEATVTSTLIFCVGPLSILGSLADGMGKGPDQLLVKAVMDGFAALAFASSLGMGVLFAVLPLALYQGALTLLGLWLGNVLPAAQLDSITATGGVILLGLGIRLLGIKQVPIGDLVPALVAAPLLVSAITAFV
jgi:uncharacterized protein